MARTEICLLGGFRVSHSGGSAIRFGSTRAENLLAYLLLHRDVPQGRRQISFLFWPDSDEGQAQTNLRRELHRLRRILPTAHLNLEIDARTLLWNSDPSVGVDVADFEEAASCAERASERHERIACLTAAVGLYRGDLLPDCYDDWLGEERDRLRARFVAALERLTSDLEGERRYQEALDHAQRLIQADPIREQAHLTHMRLRALTGDRAGVTQAFRSCSETLARELGLEPGPEIQEAYRRLQSEPPAAALVVAAPLEPLVGRNGEWRELLWAWEEAGRGAVRGAVVSGEAGIGKTRLAEELLRAAESQGYLTARAHCYRAEGRLAFAPVAEWFRTSAIADAVAKLDPASQAEVGRVLPELRSAPPTEPTSYPRSEEWQRGRLFEALSRAVTSASQPLLLLLDDAQWCDRETLEWLHHLLRFDPSARLLVLFTVRTEEQDDNAALGSLLLELRRLGLLVETAVGPLDQASTAELGANVLGRRLGEDEARDLFEASEGHPLFVVEMARVGGDAPALEERENKDGHAVLPPKVQAVITTRLSQLSQDAHELARVAAAIGRAFGTQVLLEVTGIGERALVSALDELWRRKIVREQGADEYDFSHDRIREVAYGELGPAPRRFVHRRVAEALERLHASDIDSVSVQVAAHYEQGGLVARAIHFYQRGAQVARRVSASAEAVRLLRHALDLLRQLPASPERDRLELQLQYALSAPLNVSLGYASPQLQASLERVRVLGEKLGQTDAVIRSLVGLFAVHFVQGNSLKSCQVAEEAVAHASEHPELLAESQFALGGALLSLGRFEESTRNFHRSAAQSVPDNSRSLVFGADLAVFRSAYNSHALWHLGRFKDALASIEGAIGRAKELGDPYNLALANAYCALIRQFLGDLPGARQHAEAAQALCDRYGYAYYGEWGRVVKGWATAVEGDPGSGLESIERGLAGLNSTGAAARRPYYLSLKAIALDLIGDRPGAQAVLTEALELSARCHDVWWDAELLRLQGELESSAGDYKRAERLFRQARDLANTQGSKALELRAAVSVAALLASRERREEARSTLAGILGEFTEGFETNDLREARSVLERLG